MELAQIAAGVLGVLVITSEYATGLIRTTLAAVPRRLPVLWGKAAMLAAATLTVSLPAAFVAFAAGLAVTTVRPDPASSLAPWAGFGVFCLYAAVLLSLAAVRMRRGDA